MVECDSENTVESKRVKLQLTRCCLTMSQKFSWFLDNAVRINVIKYNQDEIRNFFAEKKLQKSKGIF